MKISVEEVKKMGRLARLELSSEELELYTSQLNDILTYVSKLGELDTTGVSPTAHAMDLMQPLRADEAKPPLPRDAALKNAPDSDETAFIVPRVI